MASDEAELDEKIERKKREYEQLQKKFAKLQVGFFETRDARPRRTTQKLILTGK